VKALLLAVLEPAAAKRLKSKTINHCCCMFQDPHFIVGYFHNKTIGASAYDKPADYATWEKAHEDYVRKVVK
jgi:hypothetical protein